MKTAGLPSQLLSWGLLILTTLLLSNSAEAKVKFKIVEEIHIHKIFGLDAKLIEDNLEEADFNTKGVLYSILGMHPTDSDSLKEPGIIYLDECIRDLKKLKERNKGLKYLGFKLVDGFFISESDQFEWNKENPAEYIEESRPINIERFIDRYKKPLHKIFGNIKVYICGMKWRKIIPPSQEIER